MKKPSKKIDISKSFLGEKRRRITNVLPIVGLNVGAICSSSLFSFYPSWTFAIWLFVFIFIKSFSIELRLPGGRFSISPPSAILVRCASCGLTDSNNH